MNKPSDARTHKDAEELLEDYVLGTLSDADRVWMASHLQTCEICQEELAPLIGAMQALPFAAPEPDIQMSDAVWDRIERNISRPDTAPANAPFVPLKTDLAPQNVTHHPSPIRKMRAPWPAVAALMVLSLIGGILLAQVLPSIGEEDIQSQQIAIQFTDPDITATGELRYLPDEQVFVLSIDNMPAAPAGYVYQAWLIKGDSPVPAGVMNVSQGEVASTGDRSQFDAFAITVEPGPFGNQAPTSEPVLVAPLHDTNTT